MHSTNYIVVFVAIMTTVVAMLLTVLFLGLKPRSDANEAIFNKRAVLAAIKDYIGGQDPKDIPDEKILEIFEEQIKQIVLDTEGNVVPPEKVKARGYKGGKAEHVEMAKEKKLPVEERYLPLYIFTTDKNEKVYIVSVRGSGLWDEIWGNIALDDDLNTIVGASFDHKAETPGLGAEIKDNPGFPSQFKGKKIYTVEGQYVSVRVVKGGAKKDDPFAVDGISGATITADGVEEMLDRGIAYYEPYFDQVKAGSN